MKLFMTYILLVLPLTGYGIRLGRSSRSGLDLCPSAVAVNTSIININGHGVQKTTFACPDDSLSADTDVPSLIGRSPAVALDGISELSRRSAAECRTAAPECQCGQPTTCTCISPTPLAPNRNDCAILIDALKVIPQVSGSTFVVQPRTFELLQFESCAIEWSNVNTRNGALEYCWDEVVALTGLSNQDCIEPGISTGASCIPTDALWSLQILRIGS